MIKFNEVFVASHEPQYAVQAINSGRLSSGQEFTKRCLELLQIRFPLSRLFFTSSCTDSLEMAAVLAQISPGDEVILPSYTFTSTANAFALRAATLIFADSQKSGPNIDLRHVEELITERTKVIVVVDYAGIEQDLDALRSLCNQRGIIIVQDAAQSFGAHFLDQDCVGKWADLVCFSFHDTKPLRCGEGGLLVVNNPSLFSDAELVFEKGTNRSQFLRGESARYEWQTIGSSYGCSELQTAVLLAQLEEEKRIIQGRNSLVHYYHSILNELPIHLMQLPSNYYVNGSVYYILLENFEVRESLRAHLENNKIQAFFHYLCLHDSPYFSKHNKTQQLENAKRYEKTLLRLPMHNLLSYSDCDRVAEAIGSYFKNQ